MLHIRLDVPDVPKSAMHHKCTPTPTNAFMATHTQPPKGTCLHVPQRRHSAPHRGIECNSAQRAHHQLLLSAPPSQVHLFCSPAPIAQYSSSNDTDLRWGGGAGKVVFPEPVLAMLTTITSLKPAKRHGDKKKKSNELPQPHLGITHLKHLI